jgi:hypothetical protein
MVAWELVAVIGSLFFLGLVRGTAVCVSVCVPGLLPYLAERPRGAMGGALFGLVLCLPRLVIFAGIGLVWGALSFTIFNEAFEHQALWVSVTGYMVLGLVIAVLGLGMFLKAAREKEDLRQERLREMGGAKAAGSAGRVAKGALAGPSTPGPEVECASTEGGGRHRAARALSTVLLRLVPESSRSERTFLLLWGSILGFTCLIEVSVLELGALGAVAADFGNATMGAALLGGLAMVVFAAGATVPVVVASSAFAAYVDRVDARDKLISLRVTGSLVMVMIGVLLFVRSLAEALLL